MRKLVPGDIIRDGEDRYSMIIDIAISVNEGKKLGHVFFGLSYYPALLAMAQQDDSDEGSVVPRELTISEYTSLEYIGSIYTLLKKLDAVKGTSCEI